jgi:hypothetical protein
MMDDSASSGKKEAAETRAAEGNLVADENARRSLLNEVVIAIRCLLISMSRPRNEQDRVFNLDQEVSLIVESLERIFITEPHEVLGVFELAVRSASQDENISKVVAGGMLDIMRVLKIVFAPALASIRERAEIEQMFADLVPPTVRSTGKEV